MQTRRRRRLEAAPTATAPAAPETSILQLPDSILVQLLGQFELGFRLRTCGLVCRSWAQAAVDATPAIRAHRNTWSQKNLDGLAAWLRKHAAAAALQQLVLTRGAVYYKYTRTFALPVAQLRGLLVLKLPPCILPAGSLRELSSLTALTEIRFEDVVNASNRVVTRRQASNAASDKPDAATLAASAADLAYSLRHLPALVFVSLLGHSAPALLPALTGQASKPGRRSRRGSTSALSDDSRLQQLASLCLVHQTCITRELVAVLPTSLTRLLLAAADPCVKPPEDGARISADFDISQHATPRLGQLSQLQELELVGFGLGRLDGADGRLADLFKGLSQLTRLFISGYEAVSEDWVDADSSPQLNGFFAAVGSLSNLRCLHVAGAFCCMYRDEDDDLAPSSAPLCAGLLASTSLTRLVLSNLSLPSHCGPYMFGRPGLRLPHLEVLQLKGFADPASAEWGETEYEPYLDAADLQSIVDCCAGGSLRELMLVGVMRDEDAAGPTDYSVFAALSTLTSLSLGACTTQGIDCLTQLRELELLEADITLDTLADMTRNLTCVTSLIVRGCWAMSDDADADDTLIEFAMQSGPEQCGPQVCDCYLCRRRQEMPVCEQLAEALKDDGLWPDESESYDEDESVEDDESDDCC